MDRVQKHPVIYQGSVKDVRGPMRIGMHTGVIFDYSDAFSVFDWGRMPDLLERKGEALATLGAFWFEKLERPEFWSEYMKTAAAKKLLKANRFGPLFTEIGELLQKEGLKTHYLGVTEGASDEPLKLSKVEEPVRELVVRKVSVFRPESTEILGRVVPDYSSNRTAANPRLIPLEVIFRFSCPFGSSLLDRVARDPDYMSSLGFGDYDVTSGEIWDFPVIELFTKLETTDRPVSLSEALAIGGLRGAQMQEILLKTAWVAGYLHWLCAEQGLNLADGKLEWGIHDDGRCMLVDAIGPDELRLTKDGVPLSKEFLRAFYRGSPWYFAITQAKKKARSEGRDDWKKHVETAPPHLGKAERELATQLYLSLTNELTGKKWFPEAWSLDRVVEGLKHSLNSPAVNPEGS